ncbi:uncharacterized protein ACRADG_007193 [Cochliomyia hominivorax]
MIISKILRTLGPTVLRTAVQGNTANRARANFDADFDDDDDDSSSSSSGSDSGNSSSSSSGSRVSIELPTFEPEDDDNNEVDSGDSSTTTTTTESTKCEWKKATQKRKCLLQQLFLRGKKFKRREFKKKFI